MGLGEVLMVLFKITVLWIQSIINVFFPPAKKSLSGRTVLITGGGQGIGRELALEIARVAPGVKLVLWDLNQEINDATAAEIRGLGVEVHSYVCDVSKSANIRSVAQKVRQDAGEVDVLINNAGIMNGGPLLDLEERDIKRVFDINTLAYFWTVREFLPSMLAKNDGHIVNMASMSAKSGTAFLVDYSASKSAVYGFTEAVGEEVRKMGKAGVKTSVICPFFVSTSLCVSPKNRFGGILTAQEVAKSAVEGLLRNEEYIYVPRYLWFTLKITGMFPDSVNRYIKEVGQVGIESQYQKKD